MLHLAKDNTTIGFLDADLSTNFDDFNELVNTLQILNIK
jgi:hypothetical protein